jgi:hypothetical protein
MDNEIKMEKDLTGKNNKFYDFAIILKNLNESINFDNEFLKDCFNFSKNIGLVNIVQNISKGLEKNHRSFKLFVDNKLKDYK